VIKSTPYGIIPDGIINVTGWNYIGIMESYLPRLHWIQNKIYYLTKIYEDMKNFYVVQTTQSYILNLIISMNKLRM